MPDLTQSSFTAGEVDPALWGRKDQGIYSSGLRRAVNMIVHEGGGMDRKGVENVTKGADTVVTLEAGHGLTAGQQFYIFGVEGMPEINNRMFAVKALNTNDVTLGTRSNVYYGRHRQQAVAGRVHRRNKRGGY